MKKMYWLFLNLGLSTVHKIFLRFFAQQCSKKGKFPLLISLRLVASSCGVNRA